jgi:2,2-dialkylglycine decarboxylase (pyruvate)
VTVTSSTTTPTDGDFWGAVDRHVVRYGAPFTPEIIVRAAGTYVYTADGGRSWTSRPGR